jgi:rhodanese-related sulfurtransferase
MNWIVFLILAGLITAFWLWKRSGQISKPAARALLEKNALVVDVRTRSEFKSGHLPGALNIPVDEIETALPAKVKDRNQPMLLHCASGMRSAVARQKLKQLGYANVFNLGSYGRAGSILKAAA